MTSWDVAPLKVGLAGNVGEGSAINRKLVQYGSPTVPLVPPPPEAVTDGLHVTLQLPIRTMDEIRSMLLFAAPLGADFNPPEKETFDKRICATGSVAQDSVGVGKGWNG